MTSILPLELPNDTCVFSIDVEDWFHIMDLDTAPAFLKAGACCLGVGSSMVDKEAIRTGDMGRIRSLAEQFVRIVRETRGS